ncbi:hypothetical protein AB205_0072960 [Aquarana catesbeiana]|uniref:Uncharacterized protein n=1 Tax=Aquarana catesbeiana TaxID=8400 RepID=A0A2G9SG01_AQUCT|nr:hypothetical protein AB205_0072960 [Aquarana catesbeiana]
MQITLKPRTHELNVRQKKSEGSFLLSIPIVCRPPQTFFSKILTALDMEHVLNISDGTNSYRENRSSVCCSDGPKTTHALKQVRDESYWLLAIEFPFSSPVVSVVGHRVLDGRTLARPLEWNSVGVLSEKPSEFIPTAKLVVCTQHNRFLHPCYTAHMNEFAVPALATTGFQNTQTITTSDCIQRPFKPTVFTPAPLYLQSKNVG